jgi:hypothetical protein
VSASPKVNTGSPFVASPALSAAPVDGGEAEKSGAGGGTGFAAAADATFPNPAGGDGAAGDFVSLNASGSNCSAEGAATRVAGAGFGLECDAMGAETRFSADARDFAGVAL